MLFDLINDGNVSGISGISEYEERVTFKLLTTVLSVVYDVDDDMLNFNAKERMLNGELINMPMSKFDEIDIVTALEVASKFINRINSNIFSTIIPKELIDGVIDSYKKQFIYYLNTNHQYSDTLKSFFIDYLETKLNDAVSREDYKDAIVYRDKLNEIKNK